MILYDLKKGSEIKRIELPLSLALGCFDGLHLGHAELVAEAEKSDFASCVFTFAQNPFGVPHIITLKEKLRLLSEMGIDYCIVSDFSEIMDMEWRSFAQDVLINAFDVRNAVCGFNFKFGKNAEGNAGLLQEFMHNCGRSCRIVPRFLYQGETVSSSRIRALLSKGETEKAAQLLGRNYSLEYKVSHGNGIGSRLGFPTINTSASPELLALAKGVYICRCLDRPAVTNFGVRPTVTDGENAVYETFILDYNGDLYGENVRVEFLKMLRPEMKFASRQELAEQIDRDVEAVRNYFDN